MSFSLNSKIYIAGHNGMVGSALCRKLKSLGYHNLILKYCVGTSMPLLHQNNSYYWTSMPQSIKTVSYY